MNVSKTITYSKDGAKQTATRIAVVPGRIDDDREVDRGRAEYPRTRFTLDEVYRNDTTGETWTSHGIVTVRVEEDSLNWTGGSGFTIEDAIAFRQALDMAIGVLQARAEAE
jgi:hypothetical protein